MDTVEKVKIHETISLKERRGGKASTEPVGTGIIEHQEEREERGLGSVVPRKPKQNIK